MATVTIIPPRIQSETGIRLRVAAYCRVSSGSDDQLNSYMAQMTYYSHKFDGSETETLTDIYADEGITGTRDDKRTEFQRMIRDCRKGKIDRIYTKSISRFARNTKDCLEYLRELKSLGISVFFEKENIDTARTSDEMMVTILGGLAQEESVSISQNMRWSIKKRMQNGTFKSASIPYGYTRQGDTIIINESQAIIVRRIYNAYLSGKGIRAISNMLNDEGIPMDKSGSVWYERRIQIILTNEKYIGDSLWNKQYTIDPITHKTKKNHGEADQYYVTDTHEPIIERSLFNKVQVLLAMNRSKYCKSTATQCALQRSLRCAICNSAYRVKRINGTICWICRLHNFDAAKCPNMAVTQIAVHKAFIRLHNKLYMHQNIVLSSMIQMMQMLHSRKNSHNPNVLSIHQELAKLREQSHVLASLRTKGFLNEAKYQEQLADLNRKIGKQQKQLHLLTQNDENDEVLQQLEQLADYFADRKHPMIQFEPEAFELLVEYITVHGRESLDFHLIGGLTLKEPLR